MFVGEPLAEPVVPEPGPAGAELVGPFHGVHVAAGDVEEAGGPERGVHRVREQPVDRPASACRGDRSARKARTSSGVGRVPITSSVTRRRNSASDAGPEGSMPRARSLA